MAKYLFKSSLTVEGVKGTFADGGTGCKAAVATAIESLEKSAPGPGTVR